MLYFSTSPPSTGPATVLSYAILFIHQPALSSHSAWAKSYAYSAGNTKRVKETRPWEKGKLIPVVTLVIRCPLVRIMPLP
jgi:hypothetical protein